jgi:hypothetical protein
LSAQAGLVTKTRDKRNERVGVWPLLSHRFIRFLFNPVSTADPDQRTRHDFGMVCRFTKDETEASKAALSEGCFFVESFVAIRLAVFVSFAVSDRPQKFVGGRIFAHKSG